MKQFCLLTTMVLALAAATGVAQQGSSSGPYRVLRTAKVGGVGGFDYVYADSAGRRLYIARNNPAPRMTVFNLDTLEPISEFPITGNAAHGADVDPKSHHGFGSSKPVVMWDTTTMMPINTIDVEGNPDGIVFEPMTARVYVFSHVAPFATVINAAEGTVAGTIDLGGMPEQAVSDNKGHLYVDIEDKANVAVVDVKTLAVTAHYDLEGKGGTCAGLAFDAKNRILFAACRNPQNMVVLNADDGKILATLPIGMGTDGAVFNPATMEAFSSQGDGTLTIVKENSPTSFVVEQSLQTKVSGKTLTLDPKTNHIFVIAADYGPPPPPPPPGAASEGRGGRGGGRGQMVQDSFSILEIGK
jgi:DNA-binding beta-propeller fold protein YncE